MIARWDLAHNTASFDFFSWLVMAKAKGATEIVFGTQTVRIKRWPEDVIRKRFHSILEPGPALIGLPSRIGADGVMPHGPHMKELVAFHKAGNEIPRLSSVRSPGDAEYTVTLRNNPHIPQRNSNEQAWREFAAEIGALVFPDYDDEPIHLHERMAFYAGARMNFGMVNGPMHLCVLSECPVMMFGAHEARHAFELCGIPDGSQYPWAFPHQRLIWDPDSPENIRKHFEAWKSAQ